jgi:O-antigen ligase
VNYASNGVAAGQNLSLPCAWYEGEFGRHFALRSSQSTKLTGVHQVRRRYAGGIGDVRSWRLPEKKESFSGAFFWLTAFYFVYCARPADLIPGLGIVPLAKITGALAVLSLFLSIGKTPRKLKDLPKEAFYLLLLVILLFVSALLSPVWKGGAFFMVFDFAKVVVAWVATFLLVTTLKRLRRIIFLQSASVALISLAAIAKGHSVPRLEGVMGGFYSNPNDMAFAIVLSIPFCLAFLLSARGLPRKAVWSLAIVVMTVALMLTSSRAGAIDLVISGIVLLWYFGGKGKRPYLIVGAIVLSVGSLLLAGKDLAVRFNGLFESGNSVVQDSAHESYQERRLLMSKAVDTIIRYPILGVGAGNFVVYSGMWRDVHVSYLEIAADGGIPVLILYLMFFVQGLVNLRALSKSRVLDDETVLFLGALKSSLVGFVVGACFAPEAYQFFPYFTVCYTSVLWTMSKERQLSLVPEVVRPSSIPSRFAKAY